MLLYVLLVVATIVVATTTNAWWTSVLAFAGLAVGIGGMLMSAAQLLRDEDK
jgi:hypothetical protein